MKVNVDEFRDLVAGNSLLNQFSSGQLENLLGIIKEIRVLKPAEFLVREGEEAENLFIVKEGHLEVIKKEEDSDATHRLAVLDQGMSIGEVSLLDSGPRSASVRALEDASVLVIPIRDLESLSQADPSVDVQMKINLAYEMGHRLRTTNETTVRTLREKLNEAEIRVEMGKFMSRVLIGTCLYMFALGATTALSDYLPDTTLVTIPILIAFAIGLYLNIKTSIYPASAYGFNTENWQGALKEAFMFSLPVAGLIVVAKWILTMTDPALEGIPIFDFSRSRDLGMGILLLLAAAYACFAPAQEMIARSGMQSSFQMFLTGKHKTATSIFLSTLLFSSTHLHISTQLALVVFPMGLFWGWLYSRHPTLIGVSASHIFLGLFALFIVGFPL